MHLTSEWFGDDVVRRRIRGHGNNTRSRGGVRFGVAINPSVNRHVLFQLLVVLPGCRWTFFVFVPGSLCGIRTFLW